jgi:hypothetical protein
MKPLRKRSAPQVTSLAGRLEQFRLRAQYYLLDALQSFFGSVFWRLEQKRGQLAGKLANEGIEL